MTEQEAIETLSKYADLFPQANGEYKAIDIAISALEKQIPKKPIEKPTKSLFADLRCPDCKALIARHQKFCKECGQALDWSD